MSGLTPLFSVNDADQFIQRFEDRAEEKMYKILEYAGEYFVKIARENGKYIDHTGNLRSSVGYVIVRDGEVVEENFETSEHGTEKTKGMSEAHKFVKELALTYNSGLMLIGVAGMEYAVCVEAIEGKDVISGAYVRTEDLLRKSLQKALNFAA